MSLECDHVMNRGEGGGDPGFNQPNRRLHKFAKSRNTVAAVYLPTRAQEHSHDFK